MLQSDVEVSYRIDGKNCTTSTNFGMSMLRMQPVARMTIFDHFGEGAIDLAGGSLEISVLKSWLRSWWFWLFYG